MIKNKNNSIIRWGFHTYVYWIIRRHFNLIDFNKIEADNDKSVLLIANHCGFWDGFVLYFVTGKLFKKKFHIMLLERTSKRIPILKYGGAFSISKKTRGVIESFDYAAELLNEPGNLVLIFPQGKLYSNYITDVVFERGIINLFKLAAGKFQTVFSTTFIENFEQKKPTAYVYLKNIGGEQFSNINDLQAVYQQHYTLAHQQQTSIIKE